MDTSLSVAEVQQLVSRCPYQSWLGLQVIECDGDQTVLELPWREEFLGSPEQRAVHGGVLSALVDAAGCYAVATKLGYTVPTVDMRVDYLSMARPGNLVATGKVLKIGRLVAATEVDVTDCDRRLVAHGKVIYRNTRNSA